MPRLTSIATRPAVSTQEAAIEIVPLAAGRVAVAAVIAALGPSWNGGCAYPPAAMAPAALRALADDAVLAADELAACALPELTRRAQEGFEIWITWG